MVVFVLRPQLTDTIGKGLPEERRGWSRGEQPLGVHQRMPREEELQAEEDVWSGKKRIMFARGSGHG